MPPVHFTHSAEMEYYNTFGQISYRILRKFLKFKPKYFVLSSIQKVEGIGIRTATNQCNKA